MDLSTSEVMQPFSAVTRSCSLDRMYTPPNLITSTKDWAVPTTGLNVRSLPYQTLRRAQARTGDYHLKSLLEMEKNICALPGECIESTMVCLSWNSFAGATTDLRVERGSIHAS